MWLDVIRTYGFFCLVTALTYGVITIGIFRELGIKMRVMALIAYLATTMFITFLFAPVFFIILLFFSNEYKVAVARNLIDNNEGD